MINVEEAIKELRERPIFSTSYERIVILQRLTEKLDRAPQPIRFARLLRGLLREISIPLKEYDLFPGRIEVKELSGEEEQNFQQFLKGKLNPYNKEFISSGHRGYDWENLVKKGIIGLRIEINEKIVHVQGDDKRSFYVGMDIVLDAVGEFILRYAQKAADMKMAELSNALSNIAVKKPATFYEALLLCWIFFFIDASYVTPNPTIMIGRLDKILYPYYEEDIRQGRLTEQKAKDIIIDFYCKHNLNMGRGEHQRGNASNSTTFDRILNFDAPQYLELCGTDEQGNPVHNKLTELFVECIQPGLKNPVVIPRYYKDMEKLQPQLWKSLCAKALQSCAIIFYNDYNTINAYVYQGVPIEDARKYEHFGCNWVNLGVNSSATFMGAPMRVACARLGKELIDDYLSKRKVTTVTESMPANLMDLVEKSIENGAPFENMDQIYKALYDHYYAIQMENLKTHCNDFELKCKCPSDVLTYGECISRVIIESGASSSANGVKYNSMLTGMIFATTVDMLSVIEQLVFTDKVLSLSQLHEATKNNFEGYEKILAMCKRVDKFGSDCELSNRNAKRLLEMQIAWITDTNKVIARKYGLLKMPHLQCDTIHIPRGALVGATYDGRRAGQPFSQNQNPSPGSCKNGLIAMLSAVAKLPLDKVASGTLNVDVNPKDFEGEEGLNNFSAILSTYFASGGLQAQISAVSVDDLKDAQKNPQDHGDLLVRVTGYSGIFVDISEVLQNDIIRRMEN